MGAFKGESSGVNVGPSEGMRLGFQTRVRRNKCGTVGRVETWAFKLESVGVNVGSSEGVKLGAFKGESFGINVGPSEGMRLGLSNWSPSE